MRDPAAYSPAQELAEARQNDPDFYTCPHCGAAEPDAEVQPYIGFAGGHCQAVTWKCCGATDVDDSDDVEAAR